MEKHIKISIEKYLNETATQQERLEVEQWADSSPRNQEIFYELLENWERKNAKNQWGVEKDFQKLQGRIAKHERKSVSSGVSGRFFSGSNLFKIAAALAVVIAAYLIFKVQIPFGQKGDRMVTHTNPKGTRTRHVLPDSSVVWLNTASTLTYGRKLSGAFRTVHLEGEAFFEVKRDTLRPFVVNASDVSVEVLGTSFNVRAYGEERTIETVVMTGKVSAKAGKDGESLILSPDDKASYARQSRKMIKSQVDAANFGLWKEGILRIDNQAMQEIAQDLERWYGISVEVSGALEPGCLLTGTFNNKSLEETLSYMQALISMDYEVTGKAVSIEVLSCDQ